MPRTSSTLQVREVKTIDAVQLLKGSGGMALFLCDSCRHDWVEGFRFAIVRPYLGQKCEQCRRSWQPGRRRNQSGVWEHDNNLDKMASSIIDGQRKEMGCGKQLYAIIVSYREPDSR